MIKTFNELKLFNVTSLSEAAFYRCSSLQSIALDKITSVSKTVFRYAGIYYAWFPKLRTLSYSGSSANGQFANTSKMIAARFDSLESITSSFWNSSIRYLVCTMDSVPAGTTSVPPIVYVLDSLVSEYQGASNWSNKTIRPLSQLPTNEPDCPWLDDLRQKRLIS